MAVTNKRFTQGTVLTAVAATMYTAPVNTTSIIKKLTVTNTTALSATLTLYIIPNGGALGQASTIVSGKAIAPGETREIFEAENVVLAPGDFVQALSGTASAMALSMSGIELV